MERIKIMKNSRMRDIIREGLKSSGYDMVYQDIYKQQVIIYKNRQNHMAAIFFTSDRTDEYILFDYFKNHETHKLAIEFAESRQAEFTKASDLILNIKSLM